MTQESDSNSKDPHEDPAGGDPLDKSGPSTPEPSSTGLDANVAGALSYAGLFVTGIIFLILEKQSTFVRFHALQSTVTFAGLLVARLLLGWIPVVGGLVSFLVTVTTLILWAVFMVKAYQGERWQLPVIGEIAEERSRQL